MVQLVDETTQRRRGKETIRSTKSGRNRSFPIHTELRKMLLSMHRHIDGYVFHGSRGGRLKADTLRRILIRDVLEPLAEQFPTPKDEVGFRDGRLHSFRHFFCSLCANSGVSVQAVMHWLGHKESRMVQHYYHLHDEEAHRQMGYIPADSAESMTRQIAQGKLICCWVSAVTGGGRKYFGCNILLCV